MKPLVEIRLSVTPEDDDHFATSINLAVAISMFHMLFGENVNGMITLTDLDGESLPTTMAIVNGEMLEPQIVPQSGSNDPVPA